MPHNCKCGGRLRRIGTQVDSDIERFAIFKCTCCKTIRTQKLRNKAD